MVATYLGDGIVAYFGYPTAHEDDEERAMRAGLEIVQAVQRLDLGSDITLQARIGIASGVVVVGDLVGQGVAQQNAVIGETTNLAARLQELADPGSVVIGERTHTLVGGRFEYRDLGKQSLKGFGAAHHARQVKSLTHRIIVSVGGRAPSRCAAAPARGDESGGKICRRFAQDLIGLLGRDTAPLTGINLNLLDPFVQRLPRATDLRCNLHNRCPTALMLPYAIQHHSHGALPHFW